jgi:hypothetical protein
MLVLALLSALACQVLAFMEIKGVEKLKTVHQAQTLHISSDTVKVLFLHNNGCDGFGCAQMQEQLTAFVQENSRLATFYTLNCQDSYAHDNNTEFYPDCSAKEMETMPKVIFLLSPMMKVNQKNNKLNRRNSLSQR